MTEINNLINKLKEGSLTNSEIAYLLEYLKESQPGLEIQSLFQKAWNESPELNKEIDTKWIYNQVLNKVRINRVNDQERKLLPADDRFSLRSLKRYWMPALRYAAVFILAFALFWLVRPVTGTKELITSASQFQRVVVPYGSKTKVELPDGSVIILNSGTNLSYSSSEFNSDKRSVLLEGEGFFTVNKDLTRPFYVNTCGMRVKVLGTTFNVKAYPGENTEEATLVSGSLEIYAGTDIKENGKPILLRPNEKAVFNKSGQQISRKVTIPESRTIEPVELKALELQDDAKIEQIISWKDDKLIFDNEPFSSLMVKIERWYDVQLTVKYPELKNARFSGKFDKETVEQVMNALSTITPFSYEIRKNQITIMQN